MSNDYGQIARSIVLRTSGRGIADAHRVNLIKDALRDAHESGFQEGVSVGYGDRQEDDDRRWQAEHDAPEKGIVTSGNPHSQTEASAKTQKGTENG